MSENLGRGASSNEVSIICPPIGIGLSDLPKFWVMEGNSSYDSVMKGQIRPDLIKFFY